jgi:two-component system chemotaxis sensor kinase CheA
MGLAVDQIVDIVEDKLNIQVASERPGVLGSAVIKGQATEVIDVGHFLPLAFDDWFHRKEAIRGRDDRQIMLVDDSAFFRNLLTPVLKAAGYQVIAVESAADALALMKGERRIDVILTDIEMPDMDGFALAEAVRGDPRTAGVPIIGLSALASPEVIERGRQAGLHDFVAKFDRPGLIAALKEQTAAVDEAA